MATVYGKINGEKIQRLMARNGTVQRSLDKQALRIGTKAERLLNTRARNRTGNAQIRIEADDFDRFVILDDPDDYDFAEDGSAIFTGGDAMAIEYGHNLPQGGRARGLWVLHDASGLPRPGGA